MDQIDRPEKARRLARAIASDLSLYNEEKILEGIENDNLFEVMANEIKEGLEHYEMRVTPEIREASNYFQRALVDILFKSKSDIKSDIW